MPPVPPRTAPILTSLLLALGLAASAQVIGGAGRGMFSPVSMAWGGAFGHAISSPEAMSMGGLVPSLRVLDLGNPVARGAAAPMVQQLQMRGYEPVEVSHGRFVLAKKGQTPSPAELKTDLEESASDAASTVRFAAQDLAAQAKFGDERVNMLDTAAKLHMLSTGYSLYLPEGEREELSRVATFAESRLSGEAKAHLQAAMERMAAALSGSREDELNLLAAVDGSLARSPLSPEARKPLPKEWTLQLPAKSVTPPVKKAEVPSPVAKWSAPPPAPPVKTLTDAERAVQEEAARRVAAEAAADDQVAPLLAAADGFYHFDGGSLLAPLDKTDAMDDKGNLSLFEGTLPTITDAKGRSLRVGLSADGKLLTLSMRPRYSGENSGRVNPYMPLDYKVYLTDDESKAEHVPVIRDGRVFDTKGQPYHGVVNFVVDPQGRLYLREQRADFAHASFVAGGPAASAGELVVWNGEIVAVGPQTGHYGVTGLFVAQALLVMRRAGISLARAKLLPLTPWNGPEEYFAELRARGGR